MVVVFMQDPWWFRRTVKAETIIGQYFISNENEIQREKRADYN